MKFVELKSSFVNNLKNVYVISGDDRFVCFNALGLFERNFATNLPDFNKIIFEGDSSSSQIVESCFVLPLVDEFRLVIVKDFKPQNAKEDAKVFEKYFSGPNSSTILIFFNTNPNDFFSKFSGDVEFVDCNKLDEKWLGIWIKQNAKQHSITMGDSAISKLVDLSSQNLAKISTELSKLASYVGEGGEVTKELVERLVEEDREYQIFELSEQAGKRNREGVFAILSSILEREKNPAGIVTLLYNHFRKLLNISLSNKADADLSALMGVKPYAVKMMRLQVKNFSPKLLKRIVSMLSDLELAIKSGKMVGEIAIYYAISNILMME